MKKNTQFLLIALLSCSACNSYSMDPKIVKENASTATIAVAALAATTVSPVAQSAAPAVSPAIASANLCSDPKDEKQNNELRTVASIQSSAPQADAPAQTLADQLKEAKKACDTMAQKDKEWLDKMKQAVDKIEECIKKYKESDNRMEEGFERAQKNLESALSILKPTLTDSNTAPK